ncbi:hypothetical protein [Emergencia sp. 1XD21-10]|uniref:hypothetical protein n=1 Tax=Emergencia sp. 1XD21-10 TaxID=2304569 RepID=UPI00137B7E09|nr:hypothetical protein [Emergencia sp. 1XD21-10]NCE98837.1 hypothetical protein [Emergencia sp. 1XD21-10]
MKKKILSILCILTMVVSTSAVAFADDSNVAAYMTVPATAIDVTVTESIDMTGAANSTDLAVDKVTVTNNSAAGVINIDKIAATAAAGWTLVDAATDFKALNANAKKLSLTSTLGSSTWDITKTCPTFAKADSSVSAGASRDITFTGKTGVVTTAVNHVQAATIVVTLSLA